MAVSARLTAFFVMKGGTTDLKAAKKFRSAAALLLALCVMALCACNDAKTPEEAIKKFNKKMNDCSYKAAFDYVDDFDGLSFDTGDKSGTRQIVDAVSKTLDIEILDIQTSGATGSATLRITTVDLRVIYSRAAATVTNNYVDTVLSGAKVSAEDMRKALVKEIVREAAMSDARRVTTDCKVNLSRDKDKWYIILDTASFNIIMGYINEANSMVESGDFTNIAAVSDSDAPADDTGSEGEMTFND